MSPTSPKTYDVPTGRSAVAPSWYQGNRKDILRKDMLAAAFHGSTCGLSHGKAQRTFLVCSYSFGMSCWVPLDRPARPQIHPLKWAARKYARRRLLRKTSRCLLERDSWLSAPNLGLQRFLEPHPD